MKAIGAGLLIAFGLLLRQRLVEREREELRRYEELCRGLDILRRGIFCRRDPLPEILRCCSESRVTGPFWTALLKELAGEGNFDAAWENACKGLPRGCGELLLPLGPLLYRGEQEETLISTREEIYDLAARRRRESGEREKLITTLCLSGALLAVIVLL